MRSIFIKTISFIVFLSLCESALFQNILNDSTHKLLEKEEREAALNRNGSKTDGELNGARPSPETLSLSMDLHRQDVQRLSDLNGSSIVSSHYIEEKTIMKPTLPEHPISNITALGNFKGTISESFLKKINPHWLKYPPQPPNYHYALAIIYFIMMIFGLTGNALVIFIFIKSSNVRTPANNLILNLAFSDFIIMLEAPIFIYNSLNFGPAAGEIACKMYGMMGATGGTVAIMTLTAISIDRYNVIVFPLNPSRSTTNIRSRIMILCIWAISLPFCVLPFLEIWGVSGYIPEGFLTACSYDYLDTSPSNYWFIFIYALTAFFVPLSIITYCYFHILYVVLSAKKIQSSKEKNKTEIRLAGVVMGIIGLWLFAWSPYCIVSLIGIFGYADNISPGVSMIPAIMAKLAACFDPYVYAVTHPRFSSELRQLLCKSQEEPTSNFQTSYYSRGPSKRRGKNKESVKIGNNKERPPLDRAESSFCEESTVSMDVPVKC
ncbi:opsin, ultraviolet-sensitive [Chironomus tepperi]|uniref:opsin, ultraviolet-sensitive n=1 Tax=Chironomus tepperi TaxID=113505 RepID=UPI00391F7AB5